MEKKSEKIKKPKGPSVFSLLGPYKRLTIILVILALLANGLTLWLPKIISHGIDGYLHGGSPLRTILLEFGIASVFIFIFTYLQNVVQTFASERDRKSVV